MSIPEFASAYSRLDTFVFDEIGRRKARLAVTDSSGEIVIIPRCLFLFHRFPAIGYIEVSYFVAEDVAFTVCEEFS